MDSQLIGLVSIALGLFLGLFFGLSGLRKGISEQLSTIKEKVISIENTTGKVWDLVLVRFGPAQTVERSLENLGKVRISAYPDNTETVYRIRVEQPIMMGGMIVKLSKETEMEKIEKCMFEKMPSVNVISKNEFILHVP